MFGNVSKHVRTVLAYKNNDGDGKNPEDEEEEDIEPIGYLARILLFPIAVPVFMFYIVFYARGKPIAAELDEIDDQSDDSLDGSNDEDAKELTSKSAWNRAMGAAKRLLFCQMDGEAEASDPYALSYENFLARQELKAIKKKTAIPPYKVVLDVARTDKVKFPYDGVFVRNIYVKLSDTDTLKKMLQEIEDEALSLQSEFAENDDDIDDWSASNIRKGEAARIVKDLIAESERGKALMEQGQSPYHIPQKTSKVAGTPVQSSSRANPLTTQVPISPSPASGSSKAIAISTPNNPESSTKSSKPKKTPTPDHVPLADRLNKNVAAKMSVDGPTMDHV